MAAPAAVSTHLALDCIAGTRTVDRAGERLYYDASWVTGGATAFYSCTSLASIVIPDAVTSIGAYCFYNCLSLHDVTLSQSLTELPDNTFHWCWSLDSFTVPASVTRLGRNLVTSVYYQGVTKGPRDICFLGNAPAYDAATYSGALSSLTTYIKYDCLCTTTELYAVPPGNPRCAGFKFAGWAGSNGRRYDPGVLVFNLVPVGGTIVLTAIWG